MKTLLITAGLCFLMLTLSAQHEKSTPTTMNYRYSLSMQWGFPIWGTGSHFKSLMNKYGLDDDTPAGWFSLGHVNPRYIPVPNVSLQYEQVVVANRSIGAQLAITNSGMVEGRNNEKGDIEFDFWNITISPYYRLYIKNTYLAAGPAVHFVKMDPSLVKHFVRLKPGLMLTGGTSLFKSARNIFNLELQVYLTPGMKLGPYYTGYYQWNDEGEMSWVISEIFPKSTVALSHISVGLVYGRKW